MKFFLHFIVNKNYVYNEYKLFNLLNSPMWLLPTLLKLGEI